MLAESKYFCRCRGAYFLSYFPTYFLLRIPHHCSTYRIGYSLSTYFHHTHHYATSRLKLEELLGDS